MLGGPLCPSVADEVAMLVHKQVPATQLGVEGAHWQPLLLKNRSARSQAGKLGRQEAQRGRCILERRDVRGGAAMFLAALHPQKPGSPPLNNLHGCLVLAAAKALKLG